MKESSIRINKLSDSHTGTQPIRVLQHNIVHRFENPNSTFLQEMVETISTKGLKLGIGYHVNEESICFKINGHMQTPFVDSNKKIFIHETFASYVWCISYSLFVLYDEAIAKPSQNQFFGVEVNIINHDRISNTQELFNYGISLIKVFSVWDKEYLPNPEFYLKEDEFYIERANSVFVYAMTFILCHEYAHVEKEHIDRLIDRRGQINQREFEEDADRRAIELLLKGVTEETEKSVWAGILVGLCCLLFFNKETFSSTHPETDNRIDNFLKTIDPCDTDPIWGLATLAFKLWDIQFIKSFTWPKEANDFKELYQLIKAEISEENAAKRDSK